MTTLLNPKSLIFAFAILPAKPLADLWPELAMLAISIGAVSTAWIAAGALATRGNRLFTPRPDQPRLGPGARRLRPAPRRRCYSGARGGGLPGLTVPPTGPLPERPSRL